MTYTEMQAEHAAEIQRLRDRSDQAHMQIGRLQAELEIQKKTMLRQWERETRELRARIEQLEEQLAEKEAA